MTNYATIGHNPNNNIFNFVIEILLSTLALFSACVIVLGIAGYFDTHYSTVAEVYSVENNSILLVDGAGYLWEITDRPELHKGDMVKIKFFNNTTDYTREDDKIIKVTLLDN